MNEQLGIPVRVAEDPLTTVARGTAICLEHLGHGGTASRPSTRICESDHGPPKLKTVDSPDGRGSFGRGGGAFRRSPAVQQALRAAVLDVVVSGQSFAIDRLDEWRAAEVAMPAGLPAERAEVVAKPENDQRRALEQTCRRLRLENARLREELHLAETYGVSPIPVPMRKLPAFRRSCGRRS